MTRKHLFSIMMAENLNNINEKLQFLERYFLKFGPFSDEDMTKIKQDLSRFKSEIKRRWTDTHYKEDYFLKNNGTWLEGTFVIPKVAIRTGRPHKGFSELSENHELSAEITGIDVNFLYRLKVILEALSSGHKIDTETFSIYAKETAEQYVALYPWHPMTPTLHKILMHGSEIIDKALLPIGQLSEEAAEARNKHIRLYRQNFARKFLE